jgi:aminopeptidase N
MVLAGFDEVTGAPSIREFPDPGQFETGSREWLKAVEALKYRPLAHQGLIDNCPHDFDVLHYNITLFIGFADSSLDGNTVVTSMSETAGLSSIDLDLAVLTVDSVLSGSGVSLAYTHIDSVLTIDLGTAYGVGDTFDVQVFYHGKPGNEGPDGFGGFYFTGAPTTAFQMGVGLDADPPSMGKFWFPCWDWPCDKATAEYHITVPGTGKKVVCNGAFMGSSIDTINTTATWHWSETHQITPHCMTVHARRYKELVDSTYAWIYYWVYPPDEEDALIHYANVDIMMEGFLQRFGSYPFDKFSYVMAPKGDMEHQTCVTHIGSVVNPNHLYDWLLAHEMAHMWWGDCVSVNDWRDVWLSEGFATYGEAIYREHDGGMEGYRNYIQSNIMNPVLASGENFPIYDPNYLWGTTVYEKGACVLHMLRGVVGDSIFYDGLAAYRATYEYQSATTVQFKQIMEGVYGQSLDWFFNEWIYDVGWPEYEYSWLGTSLGDSFNLNLVIDQVQTNGPVYTMPVGIGITTTAGDTMLAVWVDEDHEEFDLTVLDEPTAVELDPENWILNLATEVPHAGVGDRDMTLDLRLEQNMPNPFGPVTTIRYSVPEPQHVRIEIYSARGQLIARLLDETAAPGRGHIVWNGRDGHGREVAPGTYFCRMTTDLGTRSIPVVLLR